MYSNDSFYKCTDTNYTNAFEKMRLLGIKKHSSVGTEEYFLKCKFGQNTIKYQDVHFTINSEAFI